MNRSELLQIAKPTVLNTEAVRSVLDGRKTTMRLAVKPQPRFPILPKMRDDGSIEKWTEFSVNPFADEIVHSPYGYNFDPRYQVGDILYVRES